MGENGNRDLWEWILVGATILLVAVIFCLFMGGCCGDMRRMNPF